MKVEDGVGWVFGSLFQQLRNALCFGGKVSTRVVICGEGCIQINLVKSLQSLCKRYDHRVAKKIVDPPGFRSDITRV